MRIEDLETPAIAVDLNVLESNIRSMAGYTRAHNLKLRPHTKTHKIPVIAGMQVEAGSRGITVAKVGEAEVMAAAGFDDLLVHYPMYGRQKADRLAQIAKTCAVTVALDSPESAAALSEAAAAAGVTFGILIEIDTGMRRCGVGTAAEAEALAQRVATMPGVRFRGITTFPGHVWLAPAQQAEALGAVSVKLQSVIDRLRSSGFECEVVSGGSTPTARNSHLIPQLTEIRPGTYVFNDRNTYGVGACTIDECALRVLVTVVSTAVAGRAIVDGGSKTFAADRMLSGTQTGFGYVVEHPDLEIASMSEEHGHMDLNGATLHVGDRLSVIPNHVCPCVNLHNSVYYHRGGVVEGCWDVAARGHVR